MLLGPVTLLVFSSLIVDLILISVAGDRVIVYWFGSLSVVWFWYVVGISFSSIFHAMVLKKY